MAYAGEERERAADQPGTTGPTVSNRCGARWRLSALDAPVWARAGRPRHDSHGDPRFGHKLSQLVPGTY